ncbi:MAG: hypothetical protein H7333_05650 [Bdellovibrionales bacterium]|nr:hypothetical protein [Oligoflexia bacterium]
MYKRVSVAGALLGIWKHFNGLAQEEMEMKVYGVDGKLLPMLDLSAPLNK